MSIYLSATRTIRILLLGCVLWGSFGVTLAQVTEARSSSPTLLVDIDHRHSVSLDGDWHTIVDPYATGLYGFHGKLRTDGYFKNEKQSSGGRLIEYDFAKSPSLRVPGDWNTQRESLFFYEGPIWYEKDFDYRPVAGTRLFFHVGAANYRSYVWVNGQKACEHEGGFTPFDCEVTNIVHDGSNFAVIAVDSTRLEDGVPTLQTDWWNYGGITRDVSLVQVPKSFVDDYSLQLKRGTKTEIEGWAHVDGGSAGDSITITVPQEHLTQTAQIEADGRAKFAFHAASLQLWSPEHPTLYRVQIRAGEDSLEDEVGFRTIETRGTQILLPTDVVVGKEFAATAHADVRPVSEVRADDMILDIGPDTADRCSALLQAAGTIIWNGPVGVFEFVQFGEGTRAIAQAIARGKAFSLAGGGDTLAAIEKYGVEDGISYISTGGGAFLEFVEGKTLPAVAILEERARA